MELKQIRHHADRRMTRATVAGLLSRWRRPRALSHAYAGLVTVLLVGAALRLVWVALLPVTPESDYRTFLDMARLIAAGQWQPSSYGWTYQGPGYPLLLAPLVRLGGGVPAIVLANLLLQLGMVAFVWLLGRRLFGPVAGLAGAALAALLPGI